MVLKKPQNNQRNSAPLRACVIKTMPTELYMSLVL